MKKKKIEEIYGREISLSLKPGSKQGRRGLRALRHSTHNKERKGKCLGFGVSDRTNLIPVIDGLWTFDKVIF